MASIMASEPVALGNPAQFVPQKPSPSYPARVGDSIRVGTAGVEGIVRFVGSTDFAPGDWLGVELWHPLGKNDGTISGRRYFSCLPMHGIFLRPHAATRGADGILEARRVDFTARMAAVAAAGGKVEYSSQSMTSQTTFGSPRNQKEESGGAAAPPFPPPASMAGSRSTPTLGRSAEEARRALAEATEDHDYETMRRALDVAHSAGLTSSDVQGAQRILTFESQRQLWDGMQALAKETEGLRSIVETATSKASLLGSAASARSSSPRAPPEVDLEAAWSEAWLDKVAARVEERIWRRFEERMTQFSTKLLDTADERLQRSLDEFRQACSELETVCLTESKTLDLTAMTQASGDSAQVAQFSPESASLRRLSWGGSSVQSAQLTGVGVAHAEVDAEADSDDEGVMRWALALAVKTGAHRILPEPDVAEAPPTASKRPADRDEVVSMSTMDTEGRSLGLFNSYADQPTPRFTPRPLSSERAGEAPAPLSARGTGGASTASSPRQRLTIANSPREELVGLLHWKLDHQGQDRGSLGKDEMSLLAMMCGFVGSDERWDLEWEALQRVHGWQSSKGLDAASLSKFLEAQQVSMEELQCMCKGLNYVRGQTTIPRLDGPPQVVTLRYNYSNVEVPKE